MAEQADGSIIVDTELDSQGFKAGSTELQRAIKSLSTQVNALGPTFQKALSGNAGAISTFDAKAATLRNTISELETKLESLGDTRVPTEDYKWLTTEIEKAEKELTKLEEKQTKLQALGISESSKQWQSLQYDIDLAKQKIEDYKNEQAGMRGDGTAFQMGSITTEYAQLESELAAARSRLAEMRAEADSAGESTGRLGRMARGVGSALAGVGRAGANGFKKIVSGIKSAISHMKSFKKSSGGTEGAIGKLGKKLTGIWSMFKRMALRKILMSVISGLKEGVNNLAQYSSGINSNLSALKSGLTQLKNSFATAFAPILSVVTPILSRFISYLSSALTTVGKFFAALTGAKTFTRAVAVQEDYASSLKDTSKAAKEAKKQLAGFDDLNILSDNSSTDEANIGLTPAEMFEEVPIESKIIDFVSRIKDAFKKGDFTEIGKTLGNKINSIFGKIDSLIKWDSIGGKITKAIKSFATGFNSLVSTINWGDIGTTFANGVNTIINTLYLLTTEIDWPALAGGIATALSNMITGIDWANLGLLLSTQARVLLQSITSAVQGFDWLEIGKSIATGINNIDWIGILGDLGASISAVLLGVLDLLIGLVDNIDWKKLGSDLWNGLVNFIQNINWSELVSKVFHLIGGAIGSLAGFFLGLGESVWESLVQGFNDTVSYFDEYIKEAGGNVIEGLWNGIKDALKNVGNWIIENIWNPFIEGFKKAFGIHSPSTKMEEQGGLIIKGLWNGIKNAWHSIVEFFTGKLDGIKNAIGKAWSGIKSAASTAWSGIKSTLSGAWNGIKSAAKSKFDSIKSSISNTWNSVKTKASSVWSSVKTTLSNSWDSIKRTASTKFDQISSSISSTWEGLKDKASTWGEDICSNLANGISGAVDWVTNAVSGVAGTIKDWLGFSEPEKGPLRNFHTFMPDMIDLMVKGIKGNQNKAVGAVSEMASAIQSEIKNGDYTLGEVGTGNGLERSLVNFSDTITDGFNSLIRRLQSIADNVTFAIPTVAKNSVIPYSVQAESSHNGNNITDVIEASNDELASVVIQAVTNASTAIVRAIQTYSGTTVNLDSNTLATGVIKEINRRTRMSGSSPLLR